MTLRVTILGCGSSGGVPRIGDVWGSCDPDEPRNRRRRCSILVQRIGPGGVTSVLVDTSPDMREQLLDAKTGKLDAVLYTHDHADQAHGIDDLRMVAMNMRARVNVHADKASGERLKRRFSYCFEQAPGSAYPAILDLRLDLEPGRVHVVDGPGGPIEALPFLQYHGEIDSLGFRFGPIAYSSDVVDMPEESFAALEGIDCWILDCLRYNAHPSHVNLETSLSWFERVKPARGILTNLHVDLDYQTLKGQVPAGVEPAYDGMVVEAEV